MRFLTTTLHRSLLEDFLEKNLPLLHGETLDIGSKNRRYDKLLPMKPISIDLISDTHHDVLFGDMHNLPFEDERFQSVLTIETLEYSMDPKKAISEIRRVLKKGGTFICSIPLVAPLHGDCIRYTEKYLRENLLTDFSRVTIFPIGNSLSILLDIIRNNYFGIRNQILRYALLPLFIPCILPALLIKKMRPGKQYISGYCIIAIK